MRRIMSLLASAAACAGLYVAVSASPAAADFGCPDDMSLVPAAFVNQGNMKDRNQNAVVCAKPTTCLQPAGPTCHGGPDDDPFGRPVLGSDGKWYYVTDDV